MTETLASKTYTPCREGIPPLTLEQAETFHAQAPDWPPATNPIRHTLPDLRCTCPRVGHVVDAPRTSVMKSRRLKSASNS
jgi:hypothetical protein